jgi:CheY-like chemotaxis protein
MAATFQGQSMTKSILIVDDNDLVRAHLRYFFQIQHADFEIHEAEDGLEAVEKAPKIIPDLIILDLAMPRLNGLEAARRLRAIPVKAPIILFTMHASIIPQSEIVSAGVNAVVSKSNLADLQQTIATFFR